MDSYEKPGSSDKGTGAKKTSMFLSHINLTEFDPQDELYLGPMKHSFLALKFRGWSKSIK